MALFILIKNYHIHEQVSEDKHFRIEIEKRVSDKFSSRVNTPNNSISKKEDFFKHVFDANYRSRKPSWN